MSLHHNIYAGVNASVQALANALVRDTVRNMQSMQEADPDLEIDSDTIAEVSEQALTHVVEDLIAAIRVAAHNPTLQMSVGPNTNEQ